MLCAPKLLPSVSLFRVFRVPALLSAFVVDLFFNIDSIVCFCQRKTKCIEGPTPTAGSPPWHPKRIRGCLVLFLNLRYILAMLLKKEREDTDTVWFLESQGEPGGSYTIPIDKDPFMVGRKQDCDLILQAPEVSRNHARLYRKSGCLYVKDLRSTNGTFVNKKRVDSEYPVRNGDVLRFGSLMFRICLREGVLDEHTATHYADCPGDDSSFFDVYGLTEREQEIFFLIIEGKSTKEIAKILFISSGTAKNHVLNIFKKADVHSRMMLMTKYLKYRHQQDAES